MAEESQRLCFDLNTFGLYKFTTSFTDPVTSARTTNSVYRVFGSQLADNRGVWGGVLQSSKWHYIP